MPCTRQRIHSIGTGVAAVGALSLVLVACGTEHDVTNTSASVPEPPALSSSAPEVGGPRPQSTTPTQTNQSATHRQHPTESNAAGSTCGRVSGPDGALRVVIVTGSVNCATAERVATLYGPKIVTGQQQTVSGWTCGPSQIEGMLSACIRGGDVIGLTP